MPASNGLDPVLEMPLWAAPSRRIKQRSESDLWWWVSRAWCSIWPLTSMAHKRGGNDRRPWNQNLCPQPCTATFGHRHLLKKNISDEQHNKRDFQLLQSPMGDGENNNNNDMTMITTKITMTKTTIEIGRRSGRGALLCLYPMDGAVINSPRAHLAQEKSHLASYPHHHPPQQHQCEHQYSDFSDGLRFSLWRNHTGSSISAVKCAQNQNLNLKIYALLYRMNVYWIAAHFEDITTLAPINSPQGVVSIAAGEGGWRKSHLTSCPAL